MLDILSIFILVIIGIGCLSAMAAVWVMGISKNASADSASFFRHNFVCKTTLSCLTAIGWLLGDASGMDAFSRSVKLAGLFWFAFGILFLGLTVYCMVTETEKELQAKIMKFGTGDLAFGIILTAIGWLLWA